VSRVVAKNERVIRARPQDIYEVLTDYKNKRPLMLTHNFLNYTVEKGGKGNGTEVSYRLRAANRERPYHLRVTEPVKGQVLTEKDLDSSLVTTWTLAPQNDGKRTRVNVTTEWEGSKGVGGFFERTFAPLGLKNIYSTMFDLLTLLVQPTDSWSTSVEETERQGFGSKFEGLALILGLVVAFSYIMSKLSRNRQ
jgi:uncharacterized protein YndB with AHSA1/START domain